MMIYRRRRRLNGAAERAVEKFQTKLEGRRLFAGFAQYSNDAFSAQMKRDSAACVADFGRRLLGG
mgnify:CR=1 FL=1